MRTATEMTALVEDLFPGLTAKQVLLTCLAAVGLPESERPLDAQAFVLANERIRLQLTSHAEQTAAALSELQELLARDPPEFGPDDFAKLLRLVYTQNQSFDFVRHLVWP